MCELCVACQFQLFAWPPSMVRELSHENEYQTKKMNNKHSERVCNKYLKLKSKIMTIYEANIYHRVERTSSPTMWEPGKGLCKSRVVWHYAVRLFRRFTFYMSDLINHIVQWLLNANGIRGVYIAYNHSDVILFSSSTHIIRRLLRIGVILIDPIGIFRVDCVILFTSIVVWQAIVSKM